LALAILVAGASLAGVIIALIGRGRSAPRTPPVPPRRFWGVITESPGLRTLVACDVAAGLWAGALEVSVTALASHHGAAELAALPLSAMAVGGIVASLWMGSRSRSPAPDRRYLAGSLLVGAALPVTLVGPSLASVTSIAVVSGAGYGVLGVALFELLDHVVPPARGRGVHVVDHRASRRVCCWRWRCRRGGARPHDDRVRSGRDLCGGRGSDRGSWPSDPQRL
jgi:hypothetical protein